MDKILVWLGVFAACLCIFLGLYNSIAQYFAEKWYFYWQVDAIRWDIRIDLNQCNWVKNPWDSKTRLPIFVPTNNDCI